MIRVGGGKYEYNPRDIIGQGSFGTIYMCYRVGDSDEILAMKVIHK